MTGLKRVDPQNHRCSEKNITELLWQFITAGELLSNQWGEDGQTVKGGIGDDGRAD